MEKLTKEQIENLPEWIPVEGFSNYEVNCREGIIRNIKTLKVLKTSLSDGYPRVRLHKDGKAYFNKVHRLVAMAAFGYYDIPREGLDVCHLDETRTNSCIDNLVLGSRKENMAFPKVKQRKSESLKGKSLSEGHRKKISEALTGKRLSEETRMKISETKKGEKHPFFGKHRSVETRKKISEATAKKAVGAYKNGVLAMKFESMMEAGRNGFSYGHISACCLGKRKTHRGYNWYYI